MLLLKVCRYRDVQKIEKIKLQELSILQKTDINKQKSQIKKSKDYMYMYDERSVHVHRGSLYKFLVSLLGNL